VAGLKIGLDLAGLNMSARQALHTASRLGVDAVEIAARGELAPARLSQTGRREVRKLLADLRLCVAAVSFHTQRGYDTLEDLDRRVKATKDALRLAYDLRAPVVINRVGSLARDDQSDAWRLLLEVLGDLGRYGDYIGAKLAAETGSDTGADVARLLAALPDGAIGIDLNPGNLILAGNSPWEMIRLTGPSILHVHATDGIRNADGNGQFVALGQGGADFPALLDALEKHHYRGYFTVQRFGLHDPLAQFTQAVEYLRRWK